MRSPPPGEVGGAKRAPNPVNLKIAPPCPHRRPQRIIIDPLPSTYFGSRGPPQTCQRSELTERDSENTVLDPDCRKTSEERKHLYEAQSDYK